MRILQTILLSQLTALTGCSLLVDKQLDDKPGVLEGGDGRDASTEPIGRDPHGSDEDVRDGGAEPSELDGATQSQLDGGTPDTSLPPQTADGGRQDDAGPVLEADVKMCSGEVHACILSRDTGRVYCWGSNAQNRSTLGRDGTLFQDIACTFSQTCGVTREGALVCAGTGGMNGGTVPTGNDFTNVALSEYHGCALRKDGSVSCWARNAFDTPPDVTDAPVSALRFSSIAAGTNFSCGVLRGSETLHCWGRDYAGIVKDAPQGKKVLAVAAGSQQGCVIYPDRKAECWGQGDQGTHMLRDVRSISVAGKWAVSGDGRAGNEITGCALLEGGRASCWRNDGPEELPGGPFLAVSGGWVNTCTLTVAGKLACSVRSAPYNFFSLDIRQDEVDAVLRKEAP